MCWDVVAFLKHRFCSADNSGVSRMFWEIKVSDVPRERNWDCKRVVGSRSMHCVNGYLAVYKCALRSKKSLAFAIHACPNAREDVAMRPM